MKIGIFLVVFSNDSLEVALDKAVDLGLDTVELGTGNYCGDAHCNLKQLLGSAVKREKLLDAVKVRGLEISALSCHGNMVHPDKRIARIHHKTLQDTIILAKKLGIKVVNNFSGVPAGGPKDKVPNWITCPWPDDFSEGSKYQWEKVLIPYWKKMNTFLKNHGIKVGLEMHPGMSVYNTSSLLRLRQECGNQIGANLDPSHLFWQGMDPIEVVRVLGKAIFHVHAKDTKIYESKTAIDGVLDTKSYLDEANRSWLFRTIGYGHGLEWWSDFVSTLRMVGYDGALSIEHEDSLMSIMEGLRKAVSNLNQVVLREKKLEAWWT